MILVFFSDRCMIMVEFLPPNQLVNQEFYVQVLQDYRKYLEKETGFVKAWFDFSLGQHNSIHSSFRLPVVSLKTNTT